ncbi:MAG: TIGR04282 family arsenosugar biosynthesis glycosyltransferase [Sphingomonas sp.]|nr:TIGR04282 family arsenosugar biosynthesis glycosyltransferase [Sphingomonas sp.]
MFVDAGTDHLLFFTRYPTPGGVKSRLAEEIGAARAADAHDVMARFCLAAADGAAAVMGASVRVLITGATLEDGAAWLGNHRTLVDQGGGGLGDRVHRALVASFKQGARRIVVMGADCPALTPALIAQGFALLDACDVALGPAVDGGFYLLGLAADASHHLPSLMADLPWGTDAARAALERNAADSGARIGMLPLHRDIDTLADIDPVRWPWLAAVTGLTGSSTAA